MPRGLRVNILHAVLRALIHHPDVDVTFVSLFIHSFISSTHCRSPSVACPGGHHNPLRSHRSEHQHQGAILHRQPSSVRFLFSSDPLPANPSSPPTYSHRIASCSCSPRDAPPPPAGGVAGLAWCTGTSTHLCVGRMGFPCWCLGLSM